MTSTKTVPDFCLPWRKHTRDDDHITDEIDFSPPSSCMYRFILDRHDELVAVVCVESLDDDASQELAERVRLFLAAPDLLQACLEVNKCGNGGGKLSRAASDKVRAAIAKAEGK